MADLIPQDFSMRSGDDEIIRFQIFGTDGEIVEITGSSITWACARRNQTPVLIQKTVGSGITITDGANGICEVSLAQADTATFVGEYYHELEVVDNTGNKSTAAFGTMTVFNDLIQ